MAIKTIKSIDKIENINTVDPTFEKYFVVLRNNRRVSESNHTQYSAANEEKSYWLNILQQYPDGTKMSIAECGNKNHRSSKHK